MFCEHLGSPPVLFCGVSLAHVFSFLCYVSCFVCLCPVSCVINVASVSGLSILDCPFSFLCCVCCFVCLCPVSCVINVASVSGLSILDCPFSFLCCVCCFVLFVLCLVYPMLPVSLDCPFLIALSVFYVMFLVLFVFVLCLV